MPNEEAHANILVEISESWTSQEEQVSRKVDEALGGEKVDAVVCVAGGWAGGNAASKGANKYTCIERYKDIRLPVYERFHFLSAITVLKMIIYPE